MLGKSLIETSFDGEWYAERYPDVGRAVDDGVISSCMSHYLEHGRAEGRFPNERASQFSRVFTVGSYGSNNIGDEAILEGVRRLYPNCIQVYANRVRNGEGVYPEQILGSGTYFQEGDHLVIGGGGLLYDRATVDRMAKLAAKATREGANVEILGLGCEAANEAFHPEIRELFALAPDVTLRSTISQAIMRDITGQTYQVRPDLAYNLAAECRPHRDHLGEVITVGIVTASSGVDAINDLKAVADLVRACTHHQRAQVRFVHIPHSRSYFNYENNDGVAGEIIWSLAQTHAARIDDPLRTIDYIDEPLDCLKLYGTLDGVISSRYHGLVFGDIMSIPTLAVGSSLLKVQSFLGDRVNQAEIVAARTGGELRESFESLWDMMCMRRLGLTANLASVPDYVEVGKSNRPHERSAA